MVGKLLEGHDNPDHGYNAATNTYEDLVKNGIIDPLKVSSCVCPIVFRMHAQIGARPCVLS